MSKTKGALIGAGLGAAAGGTANYFRKNKDERSWKDTAKGAVGGGLFGAGLGAGVGHLAGGNSAPPKENHPKVEAPKSENHPKVEAPKSENHPKVEAPKSENKPKVDVSEMKPSNLKAERVVLKTNHSNAEKQNITKNISRDAKAAEDHARGLLKEKGHAHPDTIEALKKARDLHDHASDTFNLVHTKLPTGHKARGLLEQKDVDHRDASNRISKILAHKNTKIDGPSLSDKVKHRRAERERLKADRANVIETARNNANAIK